MTFEELHNLLNKAYLMGFNNTCEGYNGEYPFDDKEINPEDDKGWVERRDESINSLVRTNEEEENEVFNPCITEMAECLGVYSQKSLGSSMEEITYIFSTQQKNRMVLPDHVHVLK